MVKTGSQKKFKGTNESMSMSNLSTQTIDHILADLCDRGNVYTSKSLPPFLDVISLQTQQMHWTLLFFCNRLATI